MTEPERSVEKPGRPPARVLRTVVGFPALVFAPLLLLGLVGKLTGTDHTDIGSWLFLIGALVVFLVGPVLAARSARVLRPDDAGWRLAMILLLYLGQIAVGVMVMLPGCLLLLSEMDTGNW